MEGRCYRDLQKIIRKDLKVEGHAGRVGGNLASYLLLIKRLYINPCHAEYIKIPHLLVIFSQLDCFIQLVNTNLQT